MSRINWKHIDEADFNALVEALLVREYTMGGLEAHALDGRGGDGGIDVEVRVKKTGQLIQTFQLKHFPGGFSGGNVGRRAQIKKSLERSISTEIPRIWTLVVPTNPTAIERKVVGAMRGGAKVTVRFMGPAELDALLAKHSDIERRFTSDSAVDLLSAVHRPEAALTKPGDLQAEAERLQQRLRGRSEYWAPSVSFGPDGTYMETLHPLRADSQEREPLNIKIDLGFQPDDIDLKLQFETFMKYGAIEPLQLPERVVRSIDKVGPEWFAEEGGRGSLEILPVPDGHSPEEVRVETRNLGEPVAASLVGTTISRASGFAGGTVRVSLDGGITQTWRLPLKEDDTGSLTSDSEFAGSSARDIRRALKFLAALETHSQVGISVAGSATIWMNVDADAAPSSDSAFANFIDELCELEDYFDVTLKYPSANVKAADRLWARILVMLLRGEAVAHPNAGTFGATSDGTLDEGMELLLSEAVAIMGRGPLDVALFGTPLHLEDVAFYAQGASIEGAEELLTELRAGRGKGRQFSIRPVEGRPWVIYIPKALEAAGHKAVIAKPWEVAGIKEHRKFNELPNRLGNQKTKS